MNGAPLKIAPGQPFPLGAWPAEDGVNFALFSRHATGVTLLLYAAPQDPHPMHRITLGPTVIGTVISGMAGWW